MRIEAAPEEGEPDADTLAARKSAVLVANKLDESDSRDNLELLEMDLAGRLPLLPVSAATGAGLEQLRRVVFERLRVIRVYTKPPGKEANMDEPTVLKEGSTVDDLAAIIHKEIREKLRYGVLWGSGRFSGQRIGRQYVLQDGDVVELIA
jgi:ribosome-interacting GTPase 1